MPCCLVPLLGGEGGEDVGLPGVEVHHLLLDQRVVVLHPGRLQVLPLLHQLGAQELADCPTLTLRSLGLGFLGFLLGLSDYLETRISRTLG